MFYKISNYILDNFLYKGQELDDEQREIMNFGIVRIIEDIPKFVGLFLIALYLNVLKELVIVFVVNTLYKTFIGGAHARTNLICFISSVVFYIAPILIAKNIELHIAIRHTIYLINFILSLYVIYHIAPADTEEVPIINKKRRNKLKVLGLMSIILIYSVSIFNIMPRQVSNLLIYSTLITNVCATQPVYSFYKCKYGWQSEEWGKYYT